MSIAEEEVGGIGVDNVVGQLTAWNYYQTVDSPENKTFVAAFKAKYGDDRATSDPMEAAYTSLYLWKGMVEKAESFDVADVQEAADGVTFDAPEGTVTVNGDNHHIAKTALHRQDRRRRPHLHRVGVGRPDRAGPVPRGLRLGRGPVLTLRPTPVASSGGAGSPLATQEGGSAWTPWSHSSSRA